MNRLAYINAAKAARIRAKTQFLTRMELYLSVCLALVLMTEATGFNA